MFMPFQYNLDYNDFCGCIVASLPIMPYNTSNVNL